MSLGEDSAIIVGSFFGNSRRKSCGELLSFDLSMLLAHLKKNGRLSLGEGVKGRTIPLRGASQRPFVYGLTQIVNDG